MANNNSFKFNGLTDQIIAALKNTEEAVNRQMTSTVGSIKNDYEEAMKGLSDAINKPKASLSNQTSGENQEIKSLAEQIADIKEDIAGISKAFENNESKIKASVEKYNESLGLFSQELKKISESNVDFLPKADIGKWFNDIKVQMESMSKGFGGVDLNGAVSVNNGTDGGIKNVSDELNKLKNSLNGLKKVGSDTSGLAEALDNISNSLNSISNNGLDNLYFLQEMNNIKITSTTAGNIKSFADAIAYLGIKLGEFQTDSKSNVTQLESLLSRSDEIKNLASIMNSGGTKNAGNILNSSTQINDQGTNSIVKKVNSLSESYQNATNKSEIYIRKAEEIARIAREINEIQKDPSGFETQEKAIEEIKNKYATILKLSENMKDKKWNVTGNEVGQALPVSDYKAALVAQMNAMTKGKGAVQEYNGATKTLTYTLRTSSKEIQTTKIRVNDLTGSIEEIGTKTRSSTNFIGRVFEEAGTRLSQFAAKLLTVSALSRVWEGMKQGVGTVKEFDTAMTELRKVSNDTDEELKAFGDSSFKIAKQVSSTGTQIVNSAADWERLGKSISEATELAKNTSILMNVSEFEDIAEATDSMVSMTQAYSIAADDSINLVDKLNNIGNNYAISTQGIATGLQDAASALVAAGNDLDKSVALITAGNSVVQDPDKVGKGLRTIALRIRGTNASVLEEMGEDTEGLVSTTSKLEAKVKALTAVNGGKGVSLFDDNGNYRDTYEILLDISRVWKEIASSDLNDGQNRQAALLEMLAGKNRANILASILQNPDLLESAYNSSTRSEGSANNELATYQKSIEAHLQLMTNQWEEMWATAVNRDVINFFVDLGTGLMSIVTDLGLVKSGLVAGGVVLATAFGPKIISAKKELQALGNEIKAVRAAGLATKGLGLDETSYLSNFEGLGDLINTLRKNGIGSMNEPLTLSVDAVAAYSSIDGLDERLQTLKRTTGNLNLNDNLFNESIVADYSSAISGLSDNQKALLLSTTGLNEEQQVSILVGEGIGAVDSERLVINKGLEATNAQLVTQNVINTVSESALSDAKKEELLVSMGLVDANTKEVISGETVTIAKAREVVASSAITAAEKEEISAKISSIAVDKKKTLSLNGLGTGMLATGKAALSAIGGLITAHPVIALLVGAVTALSAAFGILKAKEEAEQKQIESTRQAYTEAKTAIASLKGELEDTRSKADSAAETYLRLKEGVNDLNNTNLNLNSEDYESFLEASDSLAEISPDLVQGWDAQNHAIIGMNGSAEQLTKTLDATLETLDAISKKDIESKIGALIEGDITYIDEYNKKLEELNSKKDALNVLEAISGTNGLAQTKDNGQAVYDVIEELGLEDKVFANQNDLSGMFEVIVDESDIERFSFLFKQYSNEIERDAAATSASLKKYSNEISTSLSSWYTQDVSYLDNVDLQPAITQMVNAIDWNEVGDKTEEGIKKYVTDNILSPIYSMTDEAKDQLEKAVTLKETDFDSTSAYVSELDKIQQWFNNQHINVDITPIYDQSKLEAGRAAISDGMALGSKFGINTDQNNSLAQYRKENGIDTTEELKFWNDATQGAKSAEEAISNYEKSIKRVKEETIIGNTFSIVFGGMKEDIDSAQDSLNTLADAQTKLFSGELSSSEVIDLVQQFPVLMNYVDMTKDGFGNLNAGIEKLKNQTVEGVISSLDGIDWATEQDKQSAEALIATLQQLNQTRMDSSIFQINGIGGKIDETQSKISELQSALSSLHGGTLDASSVMDLAQKFPELLNYINLTDEGFGDLEHGLKLLMNQSMAGLVSEIQGIEVSTEEDRIAVNNLYSSLMQMSYLSFDNVTNGLSSIQTSAEGLCSAMVTLKEGTALSKEEMAQLALQYPELLKASDLFTTGSIEGQQAILQAVLDVKEKEYDAQIDEKIAELKAQNIIYQTEIEHEQTKANTVLDIQAQVANGTIQTNAELRDKMQTIRDLEGEDQVTYQNGVLQVNQDSLNNQLKQETEKATLSRDNVWRPYQEMVEGSFINGTSNGLVALNNTLPKINEFVGSSATMFTGLARTVQDALKGKVTPYSGGTTSLSSTSTGGFPKLTLPTGTGGIVTLKDLTPGVNPQADAIRDFSGASVSQQLVDQWAAKYTQQTVDKIDALSVAISENNIAIDNLEALKGLNLFDTSEAGKQYVKDQASAAEKAAEDAQKEAEKAAEDAAKDAENNAEETVNPQTFDWIEVALKRVQDAIGQLQTQIDSTYTNWDDRNSAITSAIGKTAEQISLQQAAYQTYLNAAESIAIDQSWKDKVKNGSLNISVIEDEELANQITQYQEWYDKAEDAKNAIAELDQSLTGLFVTSFENVQKELDLELTAINSFSDALNSRMDIIQTQGYTVGESMYQALMDQESYAKEKLEQERSALMASLASAMAGGVDEYSEQWYSMTEQINSVTEAINESDKKLVEYNNSLRQLNWDAFDKLEDKITDIKNESEWIVDLMSSKELTDENGFTKYGDATVGLRAEQYNILMNQADKYGEEIKNVNRDLANDPYNNELQERYQSLIEAQREMISAAEDEKQAMIDLANDGYKAQLEALKDLIDKRKELLNQEKSEYDYQKNVKDKSDKINSIQKQLMAYEGNNSEEGRKKTQELKSSLEDAKDDLRETEYDKYISDTQTMLDNLYVAYETFINEKLIDTDALISQLIADTNANSSQIYETLKSEVGAVGVKLSEPMDRIWGSMNSMANSNTAVVTEYKQNFNSQMTTVNASINSVVLAINKQMEAAKAQSDAAIKAAKEAAMEVNKKSVAPAVVASVEKKTTTPVKTTTTASKPASKPVSTPASTPASTSTSALPSGIRDVHTVVKGDTMWALAGRYYGDSTKWVKIQNANPSVVPTDMQIGSKLYIPYAKGTLGVPNDQLALIDELGEELILRAGNSGNITTLTKGSGVIPHIETENLMLWGKLSPVDIINSLRDPSKVQSSQASGGVGINISQLVLPSVTKPEEFAEGLTQALKNNSKVQKAIRSVTVDTLSSGSNSLSVRKY